MSILQGLNELRPGILKAGNGDQARDPGGELRPAVGKIHDRP